MKKIKTLIAAAAVLGLGVTVSSISPAAVSMQTAEAGTVRTARADRRHCHRSSTLLEEKYASLRWRRDTVLHVSCSDNF